MKKYFALFAFAALVLAGCKKNEVNVESVSVTPETLSLAIGETHTLVATVLPTDADNTKVTWSSSAPTVVSVDAKSGKVTALTAGSATVTAKTENGGKTDACVVAVSAPHSVSIVGDGFDIEEEQVIYSSQEDVHVQVDVTATKGIDKLIVEIATSNQAFAGALTEMGLGGEFDLANPTPALAGMLGQLNGLLPFGDAVKGQTELPFDISNFIPMIFAVAQGVDMIAEFTLTVSDDENNSDAATLKLNLVHNPQLINGGFEEWSTYTTWAGDIWYPSGNMAMNSNDLPIPDFWDTANEGLSMLGPKNITMYDEVDLRPGTEGTRSVKMQSTVFMTKFAAGNIYSGDFGEITTSPLGADVSFGRPFTARPSALKGWYKASPGVITNSTLAEKVVGESSDEYQIYIMLTDWAEPRVVNTSIPETLIDFEADYVIGLGMMSDLENIDLTKPVTEWTEFNIPVTYRSDKTPSYVVIVACASRYGDYFTGGTASVLQIDDFELVYE